MQADQSTDSMQRFMFAFDAAYFGARDAGATGAEAARAGVQAIYPLIKREVESGVEHGSDGGNLLA